MPAFTVKNIPDDLYARLKQSAETHHRSVNGEVIACLESVLMPRRLSPDQQLAVARDLRNRVLASKVRVEDIDNAKREGRA